MSNEIATYSMILSKLSLGKSGTECPTKTQILAINSLIVIENASTYGVNECVRQMIYVRRQRLGITI